MRLAKTLTAIFPACCICWTPFAVLVVSDPYDRAPVWMHLVAAWLAHAISSINPILYGVTNTEFCTA